MKFEQIIKLLEKDISKALVNFRKFTNKYERTGQMRYLQDAEYYSGMHDGIKRAIKYFKKLN
jgi:hypothetical protein